MHYVQIIKKVSCLLSTVRHQSKPHITSCNLISNISFTIFKDFKYSLWLWERRALLVEGRRKVSRLGRAWALERTSAWVWNHQGATEGSGVVQKSSVGNTGRGQE